ncbi:MAG: SPOR domain-containing protein [Ignavibacteriales bacterium]|nr:SPOR domain-containing protein [Ignavibacteriales bacterium]
MAGCKSPDASRKELNTKSELNEFLTKYEGTFQPSKYNNDVATILRDEKKERDIIEAAKVLKIAPPETIPGFRAQVMFTPEIDEANQLRDSISNILPDEWNYMVYETPYYKIRVGNFIDRAEANMMVKRLTSLGFKDAWVVPDKIIKNPTPKLPELQIIPDLQPDPKK